jgi:hypothetical protein
MSEPGTYERWQALLLHDWKSATVIGMGVAIATLFFYLMRTAHLRNEDNRQSAKDAREVLSLAVAHIEKNNAALAALTYEIREARPRRRPSALAPEPQGKVAPPPAGGSP